jgi:hypothetical protein
MKRTNIQRDEKDDQENEEEKEDEKGQMDVYNPDQCKVLLTSSSMFLLTTIYIYTFTQYKYDLILVPAGTFLTSINYWKKPRYNSWQRDLDVFYIYTSFSYQTIRCYNAEYIHYFVMYMFIGICFYRLSAYMYDKKYTWVSVFMHSCLHMFANIAILNVNSGYIEPFCGNSITQTIFNRCVQNS